MNLNYLNHSIILFSDQILPNWKDGYCEKCNACIFYYEKLGLFLKRPVNIPKYLLSLSCEEEMIKKLLE